MASTYRLDRVGILMEPAEGDPLEAWGVLNPASARGRDGQLYLFPRLVADGNESRVGRARVVFDDDGVPVSVERLGVVLAPEESWERNGRTGGVEDPRITFVPALDAYVMAYAAYGPLGPRLALAASHDSVTWERLGPVTYRYESDLAADFNLYPNKDAYVFPEPVDGPGGVPSLALVHRPMWDLSWIREGEGEPLPRGVTDPRPGIWVSYVPLEAVRADVRALTHVAGHTCVAMAEHPWEASKIGGGTPPIRTADGWCTVFHGVTGEVVNGVDHQPAVRYSAGVMVHGLRDVAKVVYRSPEPLLAPETDEERSGTVDNVVFPTAIEPIDDHSAWVFYGMADARVGVARLSH